MGRGKLNTKLLMFLSLFLPAILNGQIKNGLDVHFKYRTNLQTDKYPVSYLNEDFGFSGYLAPTLLGNVKVGTSLEAGVLYSKLSFFLQPSLNIGFTNYIGNDQIIAKFNNLKFKAYSIGIGCKINLVNYGKGGLIPYLIFNTGYRISSIYSTETFYPVSLNNKDDDVKYLFDLRIYSNSQIFFNPFIETGIGLEVKIKNKVYLVLEGNLIHVNYPNFDIPSPTLSKEIYLSTGFRYKFLKNKRYYYD